MAQKQLHITGNMLTVAGQAGFVSSCMYNPWHNHASIFSNSLAHSRSNKNSSYEPSFLDYGPSWKNCEMWQLGSQFPFVRPSVPIELGSHNGTISRKFDIRGFFFKNLSRNFEVHQNLTRVRGTVHEDRCAVMMIYRWILHTVTSIINQQLHVHMVSL